MHLEKELIYKVLNEFYRILKSGGKIIFDIPSEKRRKLTQFKMEGWHGSTSFRTSNLVEITKEKWYLKNKLGIAFFPLHHIPRKLRKIAVKIDSLFCRSFVKEYSSYLILTLEKK